MRKAGYGSVINMSSMGSINNSPKISAYASLKAAINQMTSNPRLITRRLFVSTPSGHARCAPMRWLQF
jgi:NADP-dependent 3-hydroxy acid dehydrogenase YdfG